VFLFQFGVVSLSDSLCEMVLAWQLGACVKNVKTKLPLRKDTGRGDSWG